MEQTYYTMLYLAFTQIKGVKVNRSLIADISLEKLFNVSEFHSMTAIVFDALDSVDSFKPTGNQVEDEIRTNFYKKYREVKEKSVRKNLLMDTERSKLFSYMNENGIWYMPLKGVVMKSYYPKEGQRQMADNDILFDKTFQKDIHDWFVKQGYDVIDYEMKVHDVYEKKPIYNFELHTSLYGKGHKNGWGKYYKDIKSRLIADDEKSCGYHFSLEDFYVYFLSHAFKHYNEYGTGVKFLMDLYLYLKKHESFLNWQYIYEEIKKLHMTEFETDSRNLSKAVDKAVDELSEMPENEQIDIVEFINGLLPESQRRELSYLLYSGNYGTLKNGIMNELDKYDTNSLWKKKFQYCMSRLFPNQEHMSKYFGILGKYKLLLPVGWIWRIIRYALRFRKKMFYEIRTLVSIKR